MKAPKEQSIETLRGLAIILVVFGHVVTGVRINGQPPTSTIYWYLIFSLELLRMPLFAAISGYVYSLRPVQYGKHAPFIKGKALRLLVPYLTLATLQFILRSEVPGVNTPHDISHIWVIYVYPYAHYWYIQGTFMLFIVIALLERYKLLSTPKTWTPIMLLAFVGSVMYGAIGSSMFFWASALYLMPFFLIGIGVHRFSSLLFSRMMLFTSSYIVAAAVLLQQLTWFLDPQKISEFDKGTFLAATVGIASLIIIFRFRISVPAFARLGAYAYTIYLFHPFCSAGARMILTRMGITSIHALIPFGLLLGIFLPIFLERILEKVPALALLFLGVRKKALAQATT